MFGLNKWWLGLVAVGVFAAGLVGSYWLGYHDGKTAGKNGCELAHSETQLKTVEKARKDYEKIDHDTPYGASKFSRIDWLFKHARNGQ